MSPPRRAARASRAGRVPGKLAWQLADQIGYLHVLLTEAARRVVAPRGVTAGELIALAVLEACPAGASQARLARLMGVTRQRAHAVAQGLAARELVAVLPHGRASLVRLSDAGRRLVAEERAGVERALAEVLGALSAGEARALSAMLARVLPPLDGAEPEGP